MSFTSLKLTSRMTLLTSEWSTSGLPPITLYFLPFLGSKDKHEKKYLELYEGFYRQIGRPLNVILVRSRGSYFSSVSFGQYASNIMLSILNNALKSGDPLMVHGMSVGCFLHAIHLSIEKDSLMTRTLRDEPFYQKAIVGQVFDSPIYGGQAMLGLPKMITGLTEGVHPPVLRSILSSTAEKYFSWSPTFVGWMDKYIEAFIHSSPQVPTLSFFSTLDPMIESGLFNDDVVEFWRQRIKDSAALAGKLTTDTKDARELPTAFTPPDPSVIRSHCFTDSRHVQHLREHPALYASEVEAHLIDVEREIIRRQRETVVMLEEEANTEVESSKN